MNAFITSLLLLLACLASSIQAANLSAFEALKLLPKEQRKRVARIEARDGALWPERWHILIHDPAAENGFREFVVEAGRIAATRVVSQFADHLTTAQILEDDLRIDSHRAADTAQQYARANDVALATMHYELSKDGRGGASLWRLTCLNAAGSEIGAVELTAKKGAVVSHRGFPREPSRAPPARASERTRAVEGPRLTREPPAPPAQAVTPLPERRPLLRRFFGRPERRLEP